MPGGAERHLTLQEPAVEIEIAEFIPVKYFYLAFPPHGFMDKFFALALHNKKEYPATVNG